MFGARVTSILHVVQPNISLYVLANFLVCSNFRGSRPVTGLRVIAVVVAGAAGRRSGGGASGEYFR